MLGLTLFLAAGSFNYWQGRVLLVVASLSTSIPTGYLLLTNPVALQRRMRAGPTAETRMAQKVLISGWYSSLAAMFTVSGLDHRFGWSSVPTAICLVGDVLVAVGLGVVMQVVIQNSHAAATVRVEAGQKVISTGLYGLVRHPVYTGNVIMIVGISLALGSYWGTRLRHTWPDRARLAHPRRGEAAPGRFGRVPRVHADGSLSPGAVYVVAAAQLAPESADFRLA